MNQSLSVQHRKRAKKRKVREKPETNDGYGVKDIISVIGTTLNHVTRDKNFQCFLESFVITVNQMRRRVSMLANELILRKLECTETLPILNQSFYSGLATSIRSGKWSHGHDEILAKWKVEDPKLGTALTQAMALVAKALAGSAKTHYSLHYERFYRTWKRISNPEETDKRYFFDPDGENLTTLIHSAWCMLKDIESVGRKTYALLPEAQCSVGYITIDNTCVVSLYKKLYPSMCPKDRNGNTKPINDLSIENGPGIFDQLFFMKRISNMRKKPYGFRYSLQTDGYGVRLSFGRWHHYKKTKRAKVVGVRSTSFANMAPGFAYHGKGKVLNSLEELNGFARSRRITPRPP